MISDYYANADVKPMKVEFCRLSTSGLNSKSKHFSVKDSKLV